MPNRLLANAPAQTTVSGSITAGATSIAALSTANFPVPSAGQQFTFLLIDSGNPAYSVNTPLATPYEYVYCTTNTVGTNTLGGLTRGVAGTSAHAFFAGATLAYALLADDLTASFLGAANPGQFLYRAYAYAGSNQTLATPGPTKITINAKDFDPNNNFDTTTNLYTCPVTGYYLCCWSIEVDANVTLVASLHQLGSRTQTYFGSGTFNQTGNRPDSGGSTIVKATAADTIAVWAEFISANVNLSNINTPGRNYLAVHLLSC